MSEFSEPWKPEPYSGPVPDVAMFSVKSADGEFAMAISTLASMDRVVACVNFLAGIPTADLDTIMQNETRWGYVKRDITQAAAFERKMQGCREGEKLSEYTFETQPTSRPSP